MSLKRWLARAARRNVIQCEGTGHKSDSFRYWLPETEAKWREQLGPELYDALQEQVRKCPFTSLQEKQRRDAAEDRDARDDDE